MYRTNTIIKLIKELIVEKKPILGRWEIKTCEEMKTKLNGIYQNRDHCGDNICTKPENMDKYVIKRKI